MQVQPIQSINIENTRLLFKNFNGAPTKFKPQGGERTFCAVLQDPVLAEQMKAAGWNVKEIHSQDPQDDPIYYIQVTARYGKYGPKIIMVNGRTKACTPLNEDSVGLLDNADISSADLTIRPYTWEPGKIKAYLKTLYVVINEDPFEHKYHDYMPNESEHFGDGLDLQMDELPF